jgi:hypothetical protein
MDHLLQSLLQILLAFSVALVLGYGVVSLMLHDQFDDVRWAAAPIVGYTLYSLLVIAISGNLKVPLFDVVVPVGLALSFLSLSVLVRQTFIKGEFRSVFRGGQILLLVLPTLLVVLGPVLVQGFSLYLGSANLDFFQSLIFQEVLRAEKLSFYQPTQYSIFPDETYLAWRSFPDQLQARFGAVAFSAFLEILSNTDAKTALTTALGVFVLCIPFAIYFFSRVVLGFSPTHASLSAVLATLSAPISLGVVLILVGQGAGLPLLPVLIGILFILINRPSLRLMALAVFGTLGMFVLYAMMLPFAVTPMAAFALFCLWRGKLRLTVAVGMCAVAILGFIVFWLGMADVLAEFMVGLRDLGSRLVGSLYFSEYLTEQFFWYFAGTVSYHLSSSSLVVLLQDVLPRGAIHVILASMTIAVLSAIALAISAWFRTSESSSESKSAVLALAAVFGAVWAYFTFFKPYGYSLFKLVTWLQFFVIPFVAFGLTGWSGPSNVLRWVSWRRKIVLIGCGLWVLLNSLAVYDYIHYSFGQDRTRGKIVFAFGLTNNSDVVSLTKDLEEVFSPEDSVGLIFTNTFQNHWASYRLSGLVSHRILANEFFPEDASYLPDPVTRKTRDSSGQIKIVPSPAASKVLPSYLLLPGHQNLNPEIVKQRLPVPVWSNATYQLLKVSDLRDFVFVGQGLYAVEHLPGGRTWWEPSGPVRWSREGWETCVLNPSQAGQPYRLKFDLLVGYGGETKQRSIEYWHGAKMIGEVVIENLGRVISPAFFPQGPIDCLTIRIKDQVSLLARSEGLWHRELPNDTRYLNALVSGIELRPPGKAVVEPAPIEMSGRAIIDNAEAINGVTADGWIQRRAELTYVAPVDAPELMMRLLVPGNPDLPFPLHFRFSVGNAVEDFVVERPGVREFRFRRPEVLRGERLPIKVEARFGDEMFDDTEPKNDGRYRGHLEFVGFRKE